MKSRLKSLLLAFLLLFGTKVFAEGTPDDPRLGAVLAADKARVAAMQSADATQLDAVLSDKLHYAHSNGVVDTKASLIEALRAGKLKYVAFNYETRSFTFPVADIALMSGRVRVKVDTAGGQIDAVLSYLAVWQLEGGHWRFLAWQSCKVPPPEK